MEHEMAKTNNVQHSTFLSLESSLLNKLSDVHEIIHMIGVKLRKIDNLPEPPLNKEQALEKDPETHVEKLSYALRQTKNIHGKLTEYYDFLAKTVGE